MLSLQHRPRNSLESSCSCEFRCLEVGSQLPFFRLGRPLQWSKSLLVFIPLLLTPGSISNFQLGVLSFIGFALASSVGYVVNDILDFESDRLHPEKKYRPVASGAVSFGQALIFAGLLFLTSLIIAIMVGAIFTLVLMFYLVLSISYSVYLKKVQVLDVVILASFYILRIVAGAVAIGVEVSQWLFTFAFLSFLSLGFAKRSVELGAIPKLGEVGDLHNRIPNPRLPGRGYKSLDSAWSFISGISSGLVSVLVLALYLDLGRDDNNVFAFALVPIWTYWILRIWLKVGRGELRHDPIAFAIRDRVTFLVGALMFLLLIFGEDLKLILDLWRVLG